MNTLLIMVGSIVFIIVLLLIFSKPEVEQMGEEVIEDEYLIYERPGKVANPTLIGLSIDFNILYHRYRGDSYYDRYPSEYLIKVCLEAQDVHLKKSIKKLSELKEKTSVLKSKIADYTKDKEFITVQKTIRELKREIKEIQWYKYRKELYYV